MADATDYILLEFPDGSKMSMSADAASLITLAEAQAIVLEELDAYNDREGVVPFMIADTDKAAIRDRVASMLTGVVVPPPPADEDPQASAKRLLDYEYHVSAIASAETEEANEAEAAAILQASQGTPDVDRFPEVGEPLDPSIPAAVAEPKSTASRKEIDAAADALFMHPGFESEVAVWRALGYTGCGKVLLRAVLHSLSRLSNSSDAPVEWDIRRLDAVMSAVTGTEVKNPAGGYEAEGEQA